MVIVILIDSEKEINYMLVTLNKKLNKFCTNINIKRIKIMMIDETDKTNI